MLARYPAWPGVGRQEGGVRHGEDVLGLARKGELGAVDNSQVPLLSGCGVEARGNEGLSSHREDGELWWCGGAESGGEGQEWCDEL